ncbi:factor-independent urate hydroxylase [Effusibacillus consociatus]|uniref:Uricase n=1 Tax=Effusibacillus consociatus TaxID=1117041 RepID=A0ABV9Q221_9BACL
MKPANSEERMMYYGKGDVFVYRTFAKPLSGIQSIPESDFTGRENIIFGMNVKIAVGGEDFLPSFTEGDNRLVVATDSMKNFIQRHAAQYEGSTMEGFLEFVSRRFLETYPQMSSILITGKETPFEAALVPVDSVLQESCLVFRHSRNEYATVTLEMVRTENDAAIVSHLCGISDLQLIKVSGNSFTGFVRDEYTTLPEDGNRPLFIYLNIGWRYGDVQDAMGKDAARYVPAEQVRDIAGAVFEQVETRSIQHLIYHIGCRVLERFPQLEEVRFESQNRTWDTVVDTIPNSTGRVYTEPRPPYGFQGFSVIRQDLGQKGSNQ